MDVTEVHSDLRVQCEAPGRLHLASWVPAEIVTPPELRVFLGQAMTMRVLSAPWLTVMTWFGDANCAPVVSSTSIVACLVWGRVCKTDSLCQSTNHELMCFEYLAIDSGCPPSHNYNWAYCPLCFSISFHVLLELNIWRYEWACVYLHEPSFSGGTPILMQDMASRVPGRGSRWQLGSFSCMRIMGLDRAMVYSAWHRSFSRASHSSPQSCRRRGAWELSSHRGKTK